MSEIGKQLGQRIRNLRTQRAARWTQEDLAQRARISISFLSMIERGQRVPHLETLVALANALDVALADLFSGIGGGQNGPSDLMGPLDDFCRARRLNARDVDRLLGVARAMFNGRG